MISRTTHRAIFVAAFSLLLSCNGSKDNAPVDMSAASTEAVEWVGFHTEVPITAADFDAIGAGLFGADAQAGRFLPPRELQTGISLSSEAETAAPAQSRIRLAFAETGAAMGSTRTLAVAPASFALGQLFLTATDAAIANMHSEEQAKPGSGETFFLEYRVSSTQGGILSLGLRGALDAYTLVIDITSPKTKLAAAQIGQAAAQPEAFDTVAGTVWFHLSKDEFDFFTDHAYGKGATGRQNFTDFHLVPFEWLRLTVDPHLDQQFVKISFDVTSKDGKRVPFASAPASVLAGATFQSLVDRNMTNMRAAEATKAGSSLPWTVPFYYDSPGTGGVVQVIAQGSAGSFQIAYAVESPRHPLTDVPFVAYKPVTIVPEDPNAKASCEKLGDPTIVLAQRGSFDITFSASSTLLASPDVTGPLVGTIYCSIYSVSDVTIAGPIAGAVSAADFHLDAATLSATSRPTITSPEVTAGDYQILCYQDVDANHSASKGDPVTLPIGSYTVACNRNPENVEFALLDPS